MGIWAWPVRKWAWSHVNGRGCAKEGVVRINGRGIVEMGVVKSEWGVAQQEGDYANEEWVGFN